MTTKIGERIEAAWWVEANNPLSKAAGKSEIKRAIKGVCAEQGLEVSPIEWRTLRPGEEGVGDLPRWAEEGKPLELLVGRVVIRAKRPVILKKSGFVADLDRADLTLLRSVTARVYQRRFPNHPAPTLEQLDEIIEQVGPESAMRLIRRAYAEQSGQISTMVH